MNIIQPQDAITLQKEDLFQSYLKKLDSTNDNEQDHSLYSKKTIFKHCNHSINQGQQKANIKQKDQQHQEKEDFLVQCQVIDMEDEKKQAQIQKRSHQEDKCPITEMTPIKKEAFKDQLSKNSLNPQDLQRYQRLKHKIGKKVSPSQVCQRNKNFPTFLVRVFLKHFVKYKMLHYQNVPLVYEKLPKSHQQLNKKFSSTKSHTIKHLLKLINGQETDVEYSRVNRRVFQVILRNHLYDQIIMNNQLKLKKTYLNMAKVFSLRCRNPKLMQRMKAK